MLYHSTDDAPYWDESAYYLFEAREVDAVEAATNALYEMALAAVGHVVENRLYHVLGIPERFAGLVARSWERDERTVYGRFDLAFDGSGPPRLLEFNADTPTALLEAAVIQWYWFQDVTGALMPQERVQFDQFNSVHERLIEAWRAVGEAYGRRVHVAAMDDVLEDLMTAQYLRDTAIQAGLDTEFLAVKEIGWDARRGAFTDLSERPIAVLFKLYPWEWMLREPFAEFLPRETTRWLEPPWKMVLSNKAILPIVFELFPESPYLLRAGFEPFGDTFVVKPTLGREGSNVTIVRDGRPVASTGGFYADGPCVYQAYHPLPAFEGRSPVVGSWVVNGDSCGMGLREDDGPVTRNTSRFVPHLFRKSPHAPPPATKSP
jgi:glutathionylspermidine synthase